MIKVQEVGMPTAEVDRRHGLFYKFEVKFGGMNASETHRLKFLEDENGRFRRLLAGAMLDNEILLGKN